MKTPDPQNSIHEAAHRHAFADGINEILVGVLLATGAFSIRNRVGVLILAVAVFLQWALPRLRDRIAAPRIGSAVLPSRPWGTLAGILVYCIGAASLVLLARWLTGRSGGPLADYRWLPVLVGLFLSGGFIHAARMTRLKRFYLYVAAVLGGGILFTLKMPDGSRQAAYDALSVLLWLLSALLVLTGSMMLILFIRRNPVFSGEAQGSGVHGH